jgi:1,4-alpha-glucan branching enzyme
MLGHVALVLHAHLPFVRHPEHTRSIEERWLFEALWECYLPLLDVLESLAKDGVRAPLSLSVSPTLAAMLRDGLLRARFDDHLARLDHLAFRERSRLGAASPFLQALHAHQLRIARARARWDRASGDVLGALVRHHDAGRVELFTTAATHAFLPLLALDPPMVRAQLRLGLRAFEAFTGRRPRGLWLPECGYDPRVGAELAAAGVGFTVLDAHGLTLARPRPPFALHAPVLAPTGVAFFGRDPRASQEVWSRDGGYPGDPRYRDFYRDIGFDLPAEHLYGETGPVGRLATGLKYHRITGPNAAKEPYDPAAASALARAHAADFRERREEALAALPRGPWTPVVVAPYDAELFGHWWFEGPEFLEAALRELAASAERGGVRPVTLAGHLDAHPEAFVTEPAASSWGEGGFGEVWTGPRAAPLLRHVRSAGRLVLDVTRSRRGATGAAGLALDQAIVELLLLQASDWPFMRHRGDTAEYAEARIRVHARRVERLAAIAREEAPAEADAAFVETLRRESNFLGELSGEQLRDAFDPWG